MCIKLSITTANKRSNSKKKIKNHASNNYITSYASALKDSSNRPISKKNGNKGLSTRGQVVKLSHIIDLNSIRNKTNKGSKENRKKSNENDKKAFKKLQLKKRDASKNSTFDFTNFKAHVQRQKMRPISRSKSREKQRKGDERIEVSPSKNVEIDVNYLNTKPSKAKSKKYYIPVTVTDRISTKSKGSRSNSKTKTVSIHKINFAKDTPNALQKFASMVS